MAVQLTGQIAAEIVPGMVHDAPPRWQLQSLYLVLGPDTSMEQYERALGTTVGSAEWLWDVGDAFRFDANTRLLRSLRLHVSERQASSDLGDWLDVPRQSGQLQLQATNNFALSPADLRWFSPSGAALICGDQCLKQSAARQRLQIAPDFELLFVDDLLCGWLLAQPARHLVSDWEQPQPATLSAAFNQLLAEYLGLISEANFDQLDAHDPALYAALSSLYDRLGSEPNTSQRDALRSSIAAAVDTFYGQSLSDR